MITITTRLAILWGLALPALAPTASAQPFGDYKAALKRYNTCKIRLPFLFHTDGRSRLASTGDQRALAILAKDYRKPHAYTTFTRYTIATLIRRHFNDADSVNVIRSLRADHSRPGDAGVGSWRSVRKRPW